VQLAFAGAALGIFEVPVEGGAVEVFSVEPDGLNLHGVVDVGEGIGGKENEVGAFSWGDEALLSGAAEKFGGVKSGGLQRGQGSKPRFDEQGEFVVQAEVGKAERVHGIGAGQKRHACAEHESDQLLVRSEEVAVELEFDGDVSDRDRFRTRSLPG